MTASSIPRRPIGVIFTLLLLAALIALLVRTAPSFAQSSSAGCVSRGATASRATRTGVHARGCAARKHNSHAKGKTKRHHAKHIKKKKSQHKPAARTPATAAPQPAVCEDASAPAPEGEGIYACADGSEPICGDGSEPTPAGNGSGPVCPTAVKPVLEFSDASCEDGSAPAGVSGGYACDDGSRPECEDGSQPVLADDGSALTCMVYRTRETPPSPSSPSEEESEGAHKALTPSGS